MLIGNYSTLNRLSVTFFGGSSGASRANFNTTAKNRNRFAGAYAFDETSSTPLGYQPPATWVMAQRAGGMASRFLISGSASVTDANLAAGINIEAGLSGSGSLSGTGTLVLSALAALSGSGSVSGTLTGKAELTASLAGSAELLATIAGIGHAVATLTGSGSVSDAEMNAIGHMEADITPFTELSPQNLAAAVWNALVTEYETAGTMGKIQGQTLTKSKFIALK